jgi:hypothetical protein
MVNHQSHPIGSKSLPEVNWTFVQKIRKNQGCDMERINGKKDEIIL